MLPHAEANDARLRSVDAYRGLVMLAMASGGIATFGRLPGSDEGGWSIPLELSLQQFEHVQWRGSVFWDLIQPSFMFLVGVAMPFSYSRRRARGDGWPRLFGHALVRSLVLVALAVFLASNGSRQTNYSFTNVLGQIGLGYIFVFLVLGRPPAVQLAAAVLDSRCRLAALRALPLTRTRLSIRSLRRKRAATVHERFLRALEQELQRRCRVRSVVSQPFPSPEQRTVPLRSGRIRDPELYPLDRDDDLRSACRRALALENLASQQSPHVAARRRRLLDARGSSSTQRSAQSSSGSGRHPGSSPRPVGRAGCWRPSTG